MLKDHVERTRTSMTDADVLARMYAGTLVVLIETARVFSFHRGAWTESKVITRASSGSEYQFVEVTYQGRKKKVALHRLVGMYSTRSLIPPRFEVDHIEGKTVVNYNGIGNLRLLPSSVNWAQQDSFDLADFPEYSPSDEEILSKLRQAMLDLRDAPEDYQSSTIAKANFLRVCEELL